MSSCGVTQDVVSKQKSLMDQHQAKIKKPKKNIRKQKQAFTISVFVFLAWYALWQNSNTNPE